MSNVVVAIVMNNAKSCNMNCRYCAGPDGHVDNVDTKININFDNIVKCIKKLPFFKMDENGYCNVSRCEVWGGEPLLKIDSMKKIMDGLYTRLGIGIFYFATNGMLLANSNIVDWIMNESRYHIEVQLSHDGLGQWIRSGNFDPLYSDSTHDNIVKLVKANHLTVINCVLNKLNPSITCNMEYFNKWQKDNDAYFNTVQMNHIQPINWEIKNLTNPHTNEHWDSINLSLEGDSMNTYIHELESNYIKLKYAEYKNDINYKAYKTFILSLCESHTFWLKDKTTKNGNCRDFALGLSDVNYTIDSMGEFTKCLLYDKDTPTPNPKCEQPEYCKQCEFYNFSACNKCPDSFFPELKSYENCQYNRAYARMCIRIKQFNDVINSNIKK